jgi:DNA segregation ATPase FtsK/SpoIIIE, S-DNA-T family
LAKKRKKDLNKEMRQQIKGIFLLAFSLFTLYCLLQPEQTGGIGHYTNLGLRTLAGESAISISALIAVFGLRLLLPQGRLHIRNRLLGLLIIALLVMVWIHIQKLLLFIPFEPGVALFRTSFALGLAREGGGIIGSLFAAASIYLFGFTGSQILWGAFLLVAILLILDLSVKKIVTSLSKLINRIYKAICYIFGWLVWLLKKLGGYVFIFTTNILNLREYKDPLHGSEGLKIDESSTELPLRDVRIIENVDATLSDESNIPDPESAVRKDSPLIVENALKKIESNEAKDPEHNKYMNYKFPPLDLLSKPVVDGEQHHKYSKERAKKLENTLLSFGVKAKVVHVQSGPTVTRFEVQPEAGVKVSKFVSLSDDLALNLAAPLVRIEAPIPGKAALGIEVPNSSISLVCLREVIENQIFTNNRSPLTIGLGKDITGVPVIADLTKMPHLLIAGATGAGKSVCLNTIITSIIYKSKPDQVRFLMIDPKVVELSVYNGIPQLLMPVLSDPRKASLALRNMVREMGRRYDLFAQLGIRDISAFNELVNEEKDLENMPYIVIVIDELADLMLVSPGEVEDSIARLAQMSRAAGIHLLVATQRPSVDVLTGIIKANITSRIAFTVSSQFDSRTILDMAGAEKLLGRGDMLFYPVGSVKPFRVQGAYVSEVEVKKVTDFIREQGLVNDEHHRAFFEAEVEEEDQKCDALFAEAVDLVVRTGQASISLLQRRFRIGYTRAARLIDDLERRNIVGPFEGSKPREVLITEEEAAVICGDFNK